MGKYFYLQQKRLLRALPAALCVILLLTASLWAALQLMIREDTQKEENQKFSIAVTGETKDSLLFMALSALKTFDSSRMSLEISAMTEAEAQAALDRGELSAYIVVPEGFTEGAMVGEITPLKFISRAETQGVFSVLKDEVTQVISELLLDSQKGVFGMEDAAYGTGLPVSMKGKMDALAIDYVDFILLRDRVFAIDSIGVSHGLNLQDALLCGLSVLLLMLASLPFAPRMVRSDQSFAKLMQAKGHGIFSQCLCDFGAYALCLGLISCLVLTPLLLLMPEVAASLGHILLGVLCVSFCLSALSFLLYSLSDSLILAVMLQFLCTLFLGFLSGCMYPISFFPVTLQNIAGYLPTGMARAQLCALFTGTAVPTATFGLLGYGLVFLAAAYLVRRRQLKEVRL